MHNPKYDAVFIEITGNTRRNFRNFQYLFPEYTYCLRLSKGSKVVIIGILSALALSVNKELGKNFYIWFYYNVSFFRNSKFQVRFGVLPGKEIFF